MKNCSDIIWNRTRNLPTCCIVPQPTALPRAVRNVGTYLNYLVPSSCNRHENSDTHFFSIAATTCIVYVSPSVCYATAPSSLGRVLMAAVPAGGVVGSCQSSCRLTLGSSSSCPVRNSFMQEWSDDWHQQTNRVWQWITNRCFQLKRLYIKEISLALNIFIPGKLTL